MDINLSKIIQYFEKLVAKARIFLAGKSQWGIVIVALVMLIYCFYLWYVYIANPHWSDSQKQEYIKTKQGQTVFDQKKFDAIISEIGRRKSEYDKTEHAPDIFRLK
jgi:hypothetical protein